MLQHVANDGTEVDIHVWLELPEYVTPLIPEWVSGVRGLLKHI